jgi:DNA-binding beta-propeller fold protein YncE
MHTTRYLPTALLGLTLILAGCAQPQLVINLADTGKGAPPKVWPNPPDIPRYRYVGELTGEENFRTEHGVSANTALNALKWLVGLGDNPNPVVLQRPQSGVVDAQGRIFVTDSNRQGVYVFDNLAGQLEVWDMARLGTKFETPIGIALGVQGQILVADAELHTVFRLDNKGNPAGEFGRDVLKRPTGMARDAKRGRIFVADTHAHDIKVFSDDGKLLKVIGKRGEGDGEFNFPTHLTFASDKLYVTDTMNSRIQIFDADDKMTQQFGKLGLYVGNLVRPKGVAVDSQNNVYVIESLYDNLLIYDSQGRTLMGLGGSGKGIGEFYLPSGVWTDSHDRVFVSDMYNGRITVLQLIGGQP